MLLVSVAMFLAIGLNNVKFWLLLATVVPVLLFHELGHFFVTMRLLGYRNVRMFFIPGFGAAVTGRHYNVPGWKKVIVSLMGPAPGIIVGVIVGLVGAQLKLEWLSRLGYFALVLNGINLLPILPLDGGKIAHAILFCRHPLLDVVFSVLACAAAITAGVLLKAPMYTYFGIFMTAGIAASYRQAKLVQELRSEGHAAISPDDQTLPQELAERIIDKIKHTAKKPLANMVVARQTLSAFESLNSRPPGWLASLGLGFLHVLFIAVALFGVGMLLVAKRGTLGGRPANLPPHRMEFATVHVLPPPPDVPESFVSVTATWKDEASAKAGIAELRKSLKPGEDVAELGEGVIMRIPAGDSELLKTRIESLKRLSATIATQSKLKYTSFSLKMVSPTPEVASALEKQASDYFQLPANQGFIAPWSSREKPDDSQLKARAMYLRLSRYSPYDEADVSALEEKADHARDLGQEEEAKAFEKQQETLAHDRRVANAKKIAGEAPAGIEADFAKEYVRLLETLDDEKFYKESSERLAPMMGQATRDPKLATWDGSWATSGWAWSKDRVLEISGVVFADPERGLTAMLDWLRANGVERARYDVYSGRQGDD